MSTEETCFIYTVRKTEKPEKLPAAEESKTDAHKQDVQRLRVAK